MFLTKRNPFRDMKEMFNDLEKSFEGLFNGVFDTCPVCEQTVLKKEDGKYVLQVPIKVDKGDIKVSVEDGFMKIEAKKEGKYSYSHVFQLFGDIDIDGVSAEYKDDKLTIQLPSVKVKSNAKQIEVK